MHSFFILVTCILALHLAPHALLGQHAQQPKESLLDDWTLLDGTNEKSIDLSLPLTSEEKNNRALASALKNGSSPKIIKRLASPEVLKDLLKTARTNFSIKHGKRSFEVAIEQNNLNYIKYFLREFGLKSDLNFISTAFCIAALHYKLKAARYFAELIPDMLNNTTFSIFQEFVSRSIAESSLNIFTTLLETNITRNKLFDVLVDHALAESETYDFQNGLAYFRLLKESPSKDLLINTL